MTINAATPTVANSGQAVLPRKHIALVAHDNKKKDLMEWARYNRGSLLEHDLCATGTTGTLLEEVLDTQIQKLQSGPLGGDQQIGALVATDSVDFVIFLRDPLSSQPHEPDINALLRLCDVHDIPLATNRRSGHIMLEYVARKKDEENETKA